MTALFTLEREEETRMSDTNAKGITSGRQDGGPRNCGPRMIAIVGPYGSGKTSLLESLLHATGATTRRLTLPCASESTLPISCVSAFCSAR